MTIVIQILVIVVALIILGTTLSKHRSHFGKASRKIGLSALALCMVVAVLFPETTNVLARSVGIGRGADLLLYLTVLSFILYALNNHLQLQDQRDMIYRLARHIAIHEAQTKKK